METGHNPRITPGTHLLLGGQGCRVFRKIAHRFFYSARESNPGGGAGCREVLLGRHEQRGQRGEARQGKTGQRSQAQLRRSARIKVT